MGCCGGGGELFAALCGPPPRLKHIFMQHQLGALLCLMRYEDWTFREAEVRLGEHIELRQALRLGRVPDHTTLYRSCIVSCVDCRLQPWIVC